MFMEILEKRIASRRQDVMKALDELQKDLTEARRQYDISGGGLNVSSHIERDVSSVNYAEGRLNELIELQRFLQLASR